jgi:hypothetical protein
MTDESRILSEPLRPKLSAEHKRKMAIGRERARLARQEKAARTQTRGRPASVEGERPMPREIPADMTPEERAIQDIIDSGGTELTRQSMQAGADFDIPLRGRTPGWAYCYWPVKVMGQEVDPSTMVEYRRGGWIPVPASHFPQLRAPGSPATTIDRHGQRMFMRPTRLNDEAQAEMHKLAYEQKSSRLAAAQAGDGGREFARRVNADGSPAARIDVDIKPLI